MVYHKYENIRVRVAQPGFQRFLRENPLTARNRHASGLFTAPTCVELELEQPGCSEPPTATLHSRVLLIHTHYDLQVSLRYDEVIWVADFEC